MKTSERNSYMLKGRKAKNGYDWWWHDIIAINDLTGKPERFFIEYYILNPKISPSKIVLGQENKEFKLKPSYSKVIAGKWGESKSQIHNYFPSNNFNSAKSGLDIKIGDNICSEDYLKGSVFQSKENSAKPELMTDAGEMSWDLQISEKVSYSVGYGASSIFRKMNLFKMYWHVEGLRTKYSGKIVYNGQSYSANPSKFIGYQDKNWGSDYTNPWIWLSCSNFFDSENKKVDNVSFDVGGGRPVVLGIPLKGKILVAYYDNGQIFDFNFTKLFFQKQKWNCSEDENYIYWNIDVENRLNALEINYKCEKSTMLKINYENPKGEKNHNNLWNGGFAEGTLKFYKKENKKKILIRELYGNLGGCEFGKY